MYLLQEYSSLCMHVGIVQYLYLQNTAQEHQNRWRRVVFIRLKVRFTLLRVSSILR